MSSRDEVYSFHFIGCHAQLMKIGAGGVDCSQHCQPFVYAMIADSRQPHKETTAVQGSRSLGLPIRDGRISIPASPVYVNIRNAISNIHPNGFQPHPADQWPTCFINDENARGSVQIKPVITDSVPSLTPEVLSEQQSRMWVQVSQMDDTNADVYDALMAIWLDQARRANSPDHTARRRLK